MVLAADTATVVWIALGVYALLVLTWFLFARRDVQGRKRATGCIWGLFLFFGLFVAAAAGYAARHWL